MSELKNVKKRMRLEKKMYILPAQRAFKFQKEIFTIPITIYDLVAQITLPLFRSHVYYILYLLWNTIKSRFQSIHMHKNWYSDPTT
jgi:hypothetical protein